MLAVVGGGRGGKGIVGVKPGGTFSEGRGMQGHEIGDESKGWAVALWIGLFWELTGHIYLYKDSRSRTPYPPEAGDVPVSWLLLVAMSHTRI